MSTSFPIPPCPDDQGAGKTRRLVVLAISIVVLLMAFFLWRASSRRVQPGVAGSQNAVGPDERAYTSNVGVDHIEISRAENFLHQEVTTLTGELYNAGTERVLGLSLTAEFSDDMNQIVLRETRNVLGSPQPALAPGERRPFEISFEHIPNSWNMQSPMVRVAHLQLTPHKP